MDTKLNVGEECHFNGILLDTWAIESFVISLVQYKAYCNKFTTPENVFEGSGRTLNGIAGAEGPIGSANIANHLKHWALSLM